MPCSKMRLRTETKIISHGLRCGRESALEARLVLPRAVQVASCAHQFPIDIITLASRFAQAGGQRFRDRGYQNSATVPRAPRRFRGLGGSLWVSMSGSCQVFESEMDC